MSEAAAVDEGPPAAVTVGTQLRLLRRARRQTLRQVAQRARVSESFLSQLERGRTGASIASLQGIAAALGVEVLDLFARPGGSGPTVLRRDDRPYVGWGTLGARRCSPRSRSRRSRSSPPRSSRAARPVRTPTSTATRKSCSWSWPAWSS